MTFVRGGIGDRFPAAKAHRSYDIVLDHLSSRKRQAETFLDAHAQVRLHFTPTYSSRLNQVEVWFAKNRAGGDRSWRICLGARLARRLRHYTYACSANAEATPWIWLGQAESPKP